MAAETSIGAGSPDRERILDDLLFAALELPDQEQRQYLEQACASDPLLLEEALRYLDLDRNLEGFLEKPAIDELIPATVTALDPDSQATALEDSEAPPSEPLESWQRDLGRRTLGTYEIVGPVGAGGMGQVYAAEDSRLGRKIAIKTLPRKMALRLDWLQRFEREARALATLNHPNIVTIYSIEEDDGVHFLTMELIEGQVLSDRLSEGGLPFDELLSIALELTQALAAAHRRGVIHRDLKPANVMMTDEGRVKILDFGIAKVEGKDQATLSTDGQLIGTVPYMSPEQLSGLEVDARSDLFSLGILFFQLASGRHPFPAASSVRRIKAIVTGEAIDLRSLRSDLPQDFYQLLESCLEKDPEQRVQTADEIVEALEGLRKDQETHRALETLPSPLRRVIRQPRAVLLVAAIAILSLGSFGAYFLRPPEIAPAVQIQDRVPLAVFFFQNLSGDPSLDWLSNGITELLITNLSQSPGLDVLSSTRLRRLLESEGQTTTGQPLPPETVQKISEAAGFQAVIRGSFVRLGDTFRLAYTLDQPGSGEVLLSESLEGQGPESLFTLVDDLSSKVLGRFDTVMPEIGPTTVEEATTSSLDAWQAFSQAKILYLTESKPEAALEALEEAIRIDPEFALALVDASKIHQSLGHGAKADSLAQEAFSRAEHLPLNTRFDAEGGYYGTQWATLEQAIETYELALRVYPDEYGWRNNLARRYAFFERYPEAVEEFEKLIGPKVGYWGNYSGLANAWAALGDFDKGYRLLHEFALERPDNWWLQYSLAWHLTEGSKFEEAAQVYDRVLELRSDTPYPYYGLWRLHVLQEDWDRADREARRLLEFDSPFAAWRGRVSLARNALYGGKSAEAIVLLEEAIQESQGAERAMIRCFLAEALLAQGDAATALEEARQAQSEGLRQWPELRGYFLAALAEQRLGQPEAADALVNTLQERWRRQPNAVEERHLHLLEGLLALDRGDLREALTALERAAALLPPRGMEFSWHVLPDHVPIWIALGRAEIASGRPKDALQWLAQATQSGSEHLEQPLPFVQSFYLAGIAHRRAGDIAASDQNLRRFLDFWNDGDLDEEWLVQARQYLEDSG